MTTGLRIGSAGEMGRGLFATKDFLTGELIERAPLLCTDHPLQMQIIPQFTAFGDYVFEFFDEDDDPYSIGLVLGFTSYCNHSSRPNAHYEFDGEFCELRALRDIRSGTQIKINYNGDPADRTPIEWWDE